MTAVLCSKYRNMETGATDSKIYNVVGDQVTLNPRYKCKQLFTDLLTPFNEVMRVPHYEAQPELMEASKTPKAVNPISEKEFYVGIWKTLKEYISENWSQTKHHVIQHSSGFDSRIMSSIIREIYRERGDDWLGEVALVCWGYERALAKKIAVTEGWAPNQFHSLPKDDAYFKRCLAFDYAWKGLNGASGYPINNPEWGFQVLRERGVVPEDPEKTQVWAASWFNEVFKALVKKESFEDGFIKFYYNCLNAQHGAAFDFEFVQPLMNPKTISFVVGARVKLPAPVIKARQRFMEQSCRKVRHIPRADPQKIPLPRKIFLQTIQDYNESWYGKTRKANVFKEMGIMAYNHWWEQWSLASLVEHLINEGIDVK